jgi:hypothetical protein
MPIPEKRVRSALFAEGFRFRLHRSDLPGSPDIVLPLYGTGRVRNVSMQPVPTELQDLSAKLKLSGTYLFEVLRTVRY